MVKTLKEKMLERRIARLEKLVTSNKRRKFESRTRTLGDILSLYAHMVGERPIDVLKELNRTTDVVDEVVPYAENKCKAMDWILRHWDYTCDTRVLRGAASGGYDIVQCSCDGEEFEIDFMDASVL